LRAFIAIDPGAACREDLAACTARLAQSSWGSGVRWVPAENLHLTLCFLGEVEAGRVEPLARALALAVRRTSPFASAFERVGLFPTERRARVVAALLADDRAVRALAERVGSAVGAAGLRSDERRFRAHLTLGRVRRPPLRGAALDEQGPFADLVADDVVLYESTLGSRGARYTELARLPLRGGSTDREEEAPGDSREPAATRSKTAR